MSRLSVTVRRVRRTVLARRRTLAAVCAAVAVAAALRAHAAPPPSVTMVLTAARDLPGGVVVTTTDLRRTAFEPDSVPAGTVAGSSALGRTTAGPMRAGEPVTDARLVTTSLLEGYPGLVAVPVRIADADAVRLLRVGDRIDVLAADPQSGPSAAVVARQVPVLAAPRSGDSTPGATTGALLLLGVSPSSSRALAQASVSSVLSVVLTR